MAARRVSKSAVNWAELYTKTPNYRVEAYRALKGKTDGIVARVNSLPEAMPQIDWAYYREHVPVAGLVDNFEKQYKGVKIPYPEDKEGWGKLLSEQEKHTETLAQRSKAANDAIVESAKTLMASVNKVPPPDEQNFEVAFAFYPSLVNDVNNPRRDPLANPNEINYSGPGIFKYL